MADKGFSTDLPSGWVLAEVVCRNGKNAPVYRNVETGQEFYSRDDLDRYMHYWNVTHPLLESGKLTYETVIGKSAEGSGKKVADEYWSHLSDESDSLPRKLRNPGEGKKKIRNSKPERKLKD